MSEITGIVFLIIDTVLHAIIIFNPFRTEIVFRLQNLTSRLPPALK